MRQIWFAAAVGLAVAACGPQKETSKVADTVDPAKHMFLEEVEGEEALDWVKGQNDRTLGILQADPRYQAYHDEALKIATSKERIPYGAIRNGFVYNFWQDETHERGLWRRTKLADYAKAQPAWETLLDIDALAKAENANWVYKGASCLPPENARCLISLSNGGKDAVRLREFDLATKSWAGGGFDLPEAKSDAVWVDKDTLLVATDWGPEDGKPTLTESGYPFVVKKLYRGQKMADAVEVYRGKATDVATSPFSFEDTNGKRWFGAVQGETFFTSSYYMLPEGAAPVKLPIPMKSSPRGIYNDRLLLTLEEDWTPEGQGFFKSGDLVAFSWSKFLADAKLPPVEIVLHPSGRQAIQGVDVARGGVLLNLSDNVVLKVLQLNEAGGKWTRKELALPPNGSAGVAFASEEEGTAFLTFEGYLSPDALYQYDVGKGALSQIKSLPAWFDAAPYQVDQYEATSKDGTKVPYFVVHKKDLALDGSNPVLQYGYGGFQVSYPPSYSGTVGKLWLEQGGVFVVANIRGGGEFGPAWHQAGLKLKRQVVYDDFIAVSEDLIAKKITSKDKLGIVGGSNGGLLMGVMFTQRPDLYKAIVCQVPLLDMLRYNQLLAGASWMDEYGDPDVPEERAFLEKLSPYHNVKADVTYPEIYFETSTKDDRVHPGHARKMARRLEDLGKPFLYYENIDGGHSAAANQREAARRSALEYTYLARKLIEGK